MDSNFRTHNSWHVSRQGPLALRDRPVRPVRLGKQGSRVTQGRPANGVSRARGDDRAKPGSMVERRLVQPDSTSE